jgi:hypothetical protein
LQEFFPAQQCFAILVVVESSAGFGVAEAITVAPNTKPVNAAPTRALRIDFVICRSSPFIFECLRLTKEVFDVQSALTSPAAFGSRSDHPYNNLNFGIAQTYRIAV